MYVHVLYVSVYMCVSAKSDFSDTHTYIQYIHILTYALGGKNIPTCTFYICMYHTPTYMQYIHTFQNTYTYAHAGSMMVWVGRNDGEAAADVSWGQEVDALQAQRCKHAHAHV